MKTLRLPEATHRLAAAALLCLGATLPAGATTLLRMDTADLTHAADRVVHARATDQRVFWDAAGTTIYTETTFQVIDEAKGSGPSTITVRLLGGRIDPVEMSAPGTPSFSLGEEVVLFATPGLSGAHNLAGYSQGVMRVKVDAATGHRTAVSQVAAGVSVMQRTASGLRQVQPATGQVDLSALLSEIRQIAAGAAGPGQMKPRQLQQRQAPEGGNN